MEIMKKKLTLVFLAGLVIPCLIAALPTTLNTNQFNAWGPLSIKGGVAVTNITDVDSLTILGASSPGLVITNTTGSADNKSFKIYNATDLLNFGVTSDAGLTTILLSANRTAIVTPSNIPLQANSVDNDVIGHERFQFENRADVTVNAGTDTTLFSATLSGSATIAADYLTQGSVIIVEMGGTLANTGGGPNYTNKVKFGSTTLATAIVTTTGVAATPQWYFKCSTTIRTNGASGSFKSRGYSIDSDGSITSHPSGSGSIDTTGSASLSVTSANSDGAMSQTADFLKITIIRP